MNFVLKGRIEQRYKRRNRLTSDSVFCSYEEEEWKNLGAYELPNVTRLDEDTLGVRLRWPLQEKTLKVLLIHFNGTMRETALGMFLRKMENSNE